MKIVMGIDPGSRVTGFGVLEMGERNWRHISHGVIVLPERETLPVRLEVLGRGLAQLMQKYHPHHVAVEKIFLGRNVESAFKLGQARGVALYEAISSGAEIFEYATRLIKKGMTGKGSAGKDEVQTMVKAFLKLSKIEHQDASDALALALYHANLIGRRQRGADQGVSL